MFGKLFGKKRKTSIGLDRFGDRYRAVRLEYTKKGPRVTHTAEVSELSGLTQHLEPADRVVTRPPPDSYFNRRTSYLKGDWTKEEYLGFAERGQCIFFEAQRWTSMPVEETLYGWNVLGYDGKRQESEIEIHQSEGRPCARLLEQVGALKLGPVYLEAWHCTSLSRVIPEKFRWYLLETRAPDGFALMRNGRLHAHIPHQTLEEDHHPERATLRHYLQTYRESMTAPDLIQAFFLTEHHRSPKSIPVSSNWVGENCRELVGRDLPEGCLQALGLALSDRLEWWLHHVSEFKRRK
jgi:hypothetical protein